MEPLGAAGHLFHEGVSFVPVTFQCLDLRLLVFRAARDSCTGQFRACFFNEGFSLGVSLGTPSPIPGCMISFKRPGK